MIKKKSKPKARLIITIILIVSLLIFDVFLFKYRNYRNHNYKIENKEKVISQQPGQITPQKKIEPVQEIPKEQSVKNIPEQPVYAAAPVKAKPAISLKPKSHEIPKNFVKEIVKEKIAETNIKPAESEKPSYTITQKDVRAKAGNSGTSSIVVRNRVIKGTVINEESGTPLSRVRINTGLSTDEILTDISGNFEISVDTAIKKIYFLCSGFEDKIIDVNNMDNSIALKKLIRSKNDDLLPKKTVAGSSDYTIAVSDSDQGFRLYKAIEMAKKGDTVYALNELNELTILNKRNIAAWNEIIKISLNSHDKKAALKGLKKLTACVSTEKLKSNISKISKLTEQGKFNEAIAELRKLKLERQY